MPVVGAMAKSGDFTKRVVMALAVLALLAGAGIAYHTLILASAQSQTSAQPRATPVVPVVVAAARREATPVRLDAVGTGQAIASVAVKSRIDGLIAEVKVRDGQYVKGGDTLLLLDGRAGEAQVHQVEAQLIRDQAQLTNAKRDVNRFAPLVAKDFVSHQQYDTAVTNSRALEANAKADEASLENAKGLLTHYTIATPMDGRIGPIGLKAGRNVKAKDLPILTINQTKPIWVAFPLAQSDFPAVRRAMEAGPLRSHVAAPRGSARPPEGRPGVLREATPG